MERLKGLYKGFSLVELVIAIALAGVVLLSASNLLINFGRFSSNVVRSEASLLGTALGTFEEIVGRIAVANEVTIPAASFVAPSIDIRVSPTGSGTSSDHSSDTYHTYWKSGTQISYKTAIGSAPGSEGGTVSADDILALQFSRTTGGGLNRISVVLEARAASGPSDDQSKERLTTTVVMRSRSAV